MKGKKEQKTEIQKSEYLENEKSLIMQGILFGGVLEAVVQRCSVEKVFLGILRNSQEIFNFNFNLQLY